MFSSTRLYCQLAIEVLETLMKLCPVRELSRKKKEKRRRLSSQREKARDQATQPCAAGAVGRLTDRRIAATPFSRLPLNGALVVKNRLLI